MMKMMETTTTTMMMMMMMMIEEIGSSEQIDVERQLSCSQPRKILIPLLWMHLRVTTAMDSE